MESDKKLEKLLDKKFGRYQSVIIEAMDERFSRIDERITRENNSLRGDIQRLTVTLDNFLKRLTDHEDEFTILKAEMDKVKAIIKEKLGVKVSI